MPKGKVWHLWRRSKRLRLRRADRCLARSRHAWRAGEEAVWHGDIRRVSVPRLPSRRRASAVEGNGRRERIAPIILVATGARGACPGAPGAMSALCSARVIDEPTSTKVWRQGANGEGQECGSPGRASRRDWGSLAPRSPDPRPWTGRHSTIWRLALAERRSSTPRPLSRGRTRRSLRRPVCASPRGPPHQGSRSDAPDRRRRASDRRCADGVARPETVRTPCSGALLRFPNVDGLPLLRQLSVPRHRPDRTVPEACGEARRFALGLSASRRSSASGKRSHIDFPGVDARCRGRLRSEAPALTSELSVTQSLIDSRCMYESGRPTKSALGRGVRPRPPMSPSESWGLPRGSGTFRRAAIVRADAL